MRNTIAGGQTRFGHGRWGGLTRLSVAALAAVLGAGLPAGVARAVPEPEPVPTKWEFEFRPGPLRLASVADSNGRVRPYVYMTYRVTNYTGLDRLLAPAFDLATRDGDVLRAGRGVPPEVVDFIKSRLGDPLLEDQLSIVSTLLQGPENARFGVVVWPLPDSNTDELVVFAAGFSGEFQAYFTTDGDSGEQVRHVLRKTLMLRYPVPGDLRGFGDAEIAAQADRWVMR